MTFGYQERSRACGSKPSHPSLEEQSANSSHQLSLTIVFTTLFGTIRAFQEAVQLADQLQARLHILVPYVVPYPLPIDRPAVSPEFQFNQLVELCEQSKAEVVIDIRLCRDARRCVCQTQLLSQIVLIGGRNSWWPLTFEKRLATALRHAGYDVLFVGHPRNGRTFRTPSQLQAGTTFGEKKPKETCK